MRVLVIPTWYPIGEDNLMGIYHKEFTYALNKHGVNANMLFIERERLKQPLKFLFSKKKNIIKESNYDVYLYKMLNLTPISFKLGLNRYVKKLDKAFKDYLKTNEMPDVIHAQVTIPAGYAACILGKKYNIPVIVTEHCGGIERFFTKEPFKEYGNFVLENSTYSTVSKYMKDIVLKYKKECYVIPNLVDTKIFNNCSILNTFFQYLNFRTQLAIDLKGFVTRHERLFSYRDNMTSVAFVSSFMRHWASCIQRVAASRLSVCRCCSSASCRRKSSLSRSTRCMASCHVPRNMKC